MSRVLRRDQARACLAYAKVGEVIAKDENGKLREQYRIRVRALATALHRQGLAVGLSELERYANKSGGEDSRAAKLLLEHLGAAAVPGLGGDAEALAGKARELSDLSKYMDATRELMRLLTWVLRAVQALLGEQAHAD